jgi:hypothetical protein
MHELSEMEVVLAYCFNEFLKMCEYIQGDMELDKKNFIEFVLYVFKEKVDKANAEELVSQNPFVLPTTSYQNAV